MNWRNKIKTDEKGIIIDGHHRAKAAQQLGIEFPNDASHLGVKSPNEFEVAWIAGIRACEEGKTLQECPHPLGSALAGEWCSGWELTNALGLKDLTKAIDKAFGDDGDDNGR